MAVFQCQDCQGTVSDKAPACPHCGAPVVKPAVEPAAPAAKPAKKGMGKGLKITLSVLAALLVVSCISAGINAPSNGGSSSTSSKPAAEPAPKTMSRVEALTACQMLIKRAANDPEKADIPYIEGIETGNEFTFKWDRNTKLARMRNGLGNEVGVTAFCSINKETQAFTQLNINGQDIPLK